MSKPRESVESKIIQYFSDESEEKVNLLFGIVKGIVARALAKKQKTAGKQKSEPKVEERSNGPAAFTKIAGDA